MPTSAPDFNAFASWSKPKSLLDFDAAKYVKPNVNPATGGYTGGPSGVPNGQTTRTQNFTANATQAGGLRQGNQPPTVGGSNAGGPSSSAPLQQPGGNNGVPRTESLKRTLLRDAFAEWERDRLIAALDATGVPCGPINTVADVFKDPQVIARGLLQRVPHPSGVDVPQVTSPMRFADTPLQTQAAPPLLGQHSDDILGELGYGAADIAALHAAGAI